MHDPVLGHKERMDLAMWILDMYFLVMKRGKTKQINPWNHVFRVMEMQMIIL